MSKNKFIGVLSTLLFFACNSKMPNTPAVNAQEISLVKAFPNLSFNNPVFLCHSNDGTNRIFVVEQEGVIRVFPNDSTVSSTEIFLNIQDRVTSGGEMGLLGLAFHPDFAGNGLFYVNYTTTQDGPRRTIVSEFLASGNQADSGSERILMEVNQPFSNHNGGMIDFGPDGYLYIAMGDGGSGGDPQNNGQDRTSLLGSILRIDVDNQDPGLNYAIPSDNPFVGEGGGVREEIFANGLRNPWRFSIDHLTGQIWAGDVGQGAWEEVDLIAKGGNYGWRIMEGFHCFNPPSNCDQSGLSLPIVEYGHTGDNCSVTGGYIYRGALRPELAGAYIYGDFCSGNIWTLRYENNQLLADSLLTPSNLLISSFGVDEQNELYIIDLGGQIYRFSGSLSTSVAENNLPSEFALAQNYPNPFNPSTTISYRMKKADLVELNIFNSLGQKIRTLFKSNQQPGDYEVTWDGRNEGGEKVSSGIYLYQLKVGSLLETRKMIFMK